MNEELVLLPEVLARRALRGRRVRLRVLAPYGAGAGCGMLRVLRVKTTVAEAATDDREVELVAGYESYEP